MKKYKHITEREHRWLYKHLYEACANCGENFLHHDDIRCPVRPEFRFKPGRRPKAVNKV